MGTFKAYINQISPIKVYDTFHDLERWVRKIVEYYFLEKELKELEMGLLDADQHYLIKRERFSGCADCGSHAIGTPLEIAGA